MALVAPESSENNTAASTDLTNGHGSPEPVRRASLPGKLKSSYKDNGSVPSYLASFEDAFGDLPTTTRTFRHSLSGGIRLSTSSRSSTDTESTTASHHLPDVDYTTQLRRRVSSNILSDSSSSLADAFLEKTKAARNRKQFNCALASMRVVKSSKERWPPNTSKALILSKSELKRRGTKSQKNEPQSAKQDSGRRDPSKLTGSRLIRGREGGSKRKEKKEQRVQSVQSAQNEVSSHSESSGEGESHSHASSEPYYDDDSTISSKGLSDLRPSYKVCYFGPGALRRGREWEDGVVDASFPTLPRNWNYDDDEDLLDTRFGNKERDAGLPDVGNMRRFDAEGPSHVDSMPSIPRHGPQGETSLPAIPSNDRRFERGRASGAPHKPGRQESIILPAVWQTRVSEPEEVDATDRKWRLKRVWEMDNEVVDDSEPDYVVSEPNLKQALTALLCVPDNTDEADAGTSCTRPESSSEPSDESADTKNFWKMQRVWDRHGEVVAIDDAESIAGDAMLQLFEADTHETKDSLVLEYADETAARSAEKESGTNEQGTTSVTEDDSESIGLDDLHESGGSLDSFGNSIHDPEALEQKLVQVEQEINDVMFDASNSSLTRDKVHKLQEKLSRCMEKMEQAELRRYNESLDGLGGSFGSISLDDDAGSFSSPLEAEAFRDEELIRRKLRKTEKMMISLLEKKGPDAKKKKKYKSLAKKREQYLQELAECSSDHGQRSLMSRTSMLNDLGMDVIAEEESIGSVERRDRELLTRKLRKVEKSMARMEEDKGEGARSTRKYRQLLEKREQYEEELGL